MGGGAPLPDEPLVPLRLLRYLGVMLKAPACSALHSLC